jgi:hypothetical protein
MPAGRMSVRTAVQSPTVSKCPHTVTSGWGRVAKGVRALTLNQRNTRDYHRYMASREWAIKKRQIRERSDGKCERCRAPQEATHHLTYERLGDEWLSDLLAVCSPCHEFLSGMRDDDPAAATVLSPADYVDWVCHQVRYGLAHGAEPGLETMKAVGALWRVFYKEVYQSDA